MDVFKGRDKDADFKAWMQNNPEGFYVNAPSGKAPMLHRVGCSHLGGGEGMNSTKNAKYCSTQVQELISQFSKAGLEMCSTCDPL